MSKPKFIIRLAVLADCEAIASIHVQAWQESYVGIVSEHYLQSISFEERLQLRKKILTHHDANCIHLVAIINDEIVGFCDAGPAFTPKEQYRGEIYAIYLLEKYKKAGIGSALFETAKSHLVHKNLLPFVISVLKENHIACRFYEKHGGCYSGEETVEIDNKFYPESVYIFK